MNARMVVWIASALVSFVPAVVHAADEPKPNTLTAKEITDGWIMLFDGETPFGWTFKAAKDPTVAKGAIQLSGDEALATTTSQFGCFDLTFDYLCAAKGAQLVLGDQHQELTETAKDKWTQAVVRSNVRGKDWHVTLAFIPAGEKPSGMRDSTVKDTAPRTAIGFIAPKGSELQLRNVKLKPVAMQSLFNGKNLDGWNIVPDHDSKFSVTEKGELNIKNGNGEIKTDGQWADFILQLDVFSNGKNLNSGIFFRALPGPEQFWQGYEAQIRNEWDGYSNDGDTAKKPEDRNKPRDIGTGGIYNRQPSRRVVSSDKEWFTYTVLAHGNHIATWVNGYQTADYFDTNTPRKTVRNGGRRVEKGVISLQGHDPTTDLSFRNIRLQELPSEKAK